MMRFAFICAAAENISLRFSTMTDYAIFVLIALIFIFVKLNCWIKDWCCFRLISLLDCIIWFSLDFGLVSAKRFSSSWLNIIKLYFDCKTTP